MENKINVLGIQIDRLTQKVLHENIENVLYRGHHVKVFTPNPEILIKAQKDIKTKEILESGDILIPDGIGVILGSKILGTPLPERLTGIDTAEFILDLAAKRGFSVFLLGGKDGVSSSAKKKLEEKHKNLNICGTYHGFFNIKGRENDEIISLINNSGADVLFVCMGFPRQERWITENIEKLPYLRLAIGLGGSLDVWSGKLRRAPLIFRKLSLEWLWRMVLEPKRAKFLLTIPIFFCKILMQRFKINKY